MIEVTRLDPETDEDTYVIDFFDPKEKTGRMITLSQDEYDALHDTLTVHGEIPQMSESEEWKGAGWSASTSSTWATNIPEPTERELQLIEEMNTVLEKVDDLQGFLAAAEDQTDAWRRQAEQLTEVIHHLTIV